MSSATPQLLNNLIAIFPHEPTDKLKRILAASNNNLDRAVNALLTRAGDAVIVGSQPKKRRMAASSASASARLDGWFLKQPESKHNLLATAAKRSPPSTSAAMTGTSRPSTTAPPPPPLKSAFDLLKPTSSSSSPTPPPTNALPPLTLTTPQAVHLHTGGLVTLIPDVLPKGLASRLFLRMVDESLGTNTETGNPWEKNRWYMFDREVESPHTTSFYVEPPKSPADGREESAYDQGGFAEAARYWYNGEEKEARTFNSEMNEAREVITPLIRKVLAARGKHSLEFDGLWTPNVSAANCYRGAKESVGWHSDVLTYLGPYPTIASLSLGGTRPFKLRAFAPVNQQGPSTPPRTLSIPLPHGSLLIMHAGCQEKFKHSVPPVNGMDVFRLPRDHGLPEGLYPSERLTQAYRERINMTFRFYRPDFAPLPRGVKPPPPKSGEYIGTPLCRCGIPCHLRPDGRGKAKAHLGGAGKRKRDQELENGEQKEEEEEEILFFWTCNAGAQNEGKTCGMWELLDMTKEGRGKWWPGRIQK